MCLISCGIEPILLLYSTLDGLVKKRQSPKSSPLWDLYSVTCPVYILLLAPEWHHKSGNKSPVLRIQYLKEAKKMLMNNTIGEFDSVDAYFRRLSVTISQWVRAGMRQICIQPLEMDQLITFEVIAMCITARYQHLICQRRRLILTLKCHKFTIDPSWSVAEWHYTIRNGPFHAI